MRLSDESVRRALTWCRNYEEIESYKAVPGARGRKWLIVLPQAPRIATPGVFTNRPEDVLPAEIVLTNREALAFAFGCAAGGIHDRTEFAREKWGWGAENEPPEDPAEVKALTDETEPNV